MADNLQTLALLVLAQDYKGNVVRQINRRAQTLKMLPVRRGAGQNVAFVAESSGMLFENYDETSTDVLNYGSDAQDKCLLNWSMNRANFHISGLAQATSATSSSPEGDMELMYRNMENASLVLASGLNKQLVTGAGTGTLLFGLDGAIGTINNTYGGIDRSSKTYFNPNVFNSAGPASALTFAQIRGDMQAIYIASGLRPNIAGVHPNVLAKMAGLFDPQKQYLFEVVKDVETAAGKFSLEGGIGGIRFDGCVFYEDKDLTDGCIYYMNTDKMHLEVLPMNLAKIPGMTDEIAEIIGNDGFGPLPFGFQLEMLSHTGDADKAFVKCYSQLCVTQPNATGKRLNIA